MSVNKGEEEENQDKSLEDMSEEELEAQYEKQLAGESENSDPDDDGSQEPGNDDDSNEDTNEPEMSASEKALIKEMKGLQKMFARNQTELSNFKKDIDGIRNRESDDGSQDEDDIDPYTEPEKFLDKRLEKREKAQARSQQEAQEKVDNTRDFVHGKIENFEDNIDSMSEELEDMLGDDPDAKSYAKNFKDNPYVVDSLTLLWAGRAAALRSEIAQLKGEASKAGNGKADLISKINKLGKNKSTVNGNSNGSGNGGKQVTLTAKKIESMSLEDLDKAYELELEQDNQ